MFRSRQRKSAPKVVNGKVQRKNRIAVTSTYFNTPQAMPVIDRLKPGFGYRHVLKKKDVLAFIELLPDWKELSKGLNAVLLTQGEHNVAGWHRPGVVAVCAWERDLWQELHTWFYQDHRDVFAMLGVPCEETKAGREGTFLCKWTESTARAYQLVHILLHELGHHHDRMTTKSQRRSCRGEGYAEQYALRYADLIWDRYLDRFGLP